MTNSTQPKQNVYMRVLRYLAPYKGPFVFAILCMVIFGASDGAVPFIVKHMLDGVFAQQNKTLLTILPLVIIFFAVVRGAADFGQQYLSSKIGHNIVRDVRNEVNNHLLTLSPSYFIEKSSADMLARLTSDVVLMRTLLTDSVASILRDSIRVIGLLVSAFVLDPVLALIAFVAFPIGIYPVYRFGRKMRKLSKKGQDAIGSLSAMLQESIIGNRVVKICGRESYEDARFRLENEKLTNTFVASEKIRALTGPINEILASAAISGVLLYGGLSVINGVRTQGDFIAFLIAVFLLYDPFKKLSRIHNVVQQGIVGAERIFEVLDHEADIVDPASPISLGEQNSIEFDNVTFAYDKTDTDALTNISLTVPEHSRVAIVGFSGAGKSTLIDLVPRFIQPQRGVVKIGGVDVAKVKLSELRARIALVGQHTFLFNDTVFNNIAYGMPGASKEDVYAAARAAYAHDFILQLPQGYETTVGESGFSLSGGERQRVAIARAILKNAPILILDEATASLDNRAEREVQAALEALERNRTTLVIAHRLSTIRTADQIVVLKSGIIAEVGTHEQLLEKKNEYAKLYALQFAQLERESDEVTIN